MKKGRKGRKRGRREGRKQARIERRKNSGKVKERGRKSKTEKLGNKE